MDRILDLDAGSARYGQMLAKNNPESSILSVSQWNELGNRVSFAVKECTEYDEPEDNAELISDESILEYNQFYQDQEFKNHRLIIYHPAGYVEEAANDGDKFKEISHCFPGGDEYCLLDNPETVDTMLNLIVPGGELILREGFGSANLEKIYEKRFETVLKTQRDKWKTFADGAKILTKEELSLHDFILSNVKMFAELRFRKI